MFHYYFLVFIVLPILTLWLIYRWFFFVYVPPGHVVYLRNIWSHRSHYMYDNPGVAFVPPWQSVYYCSVTPHYWSEMTHLRSFRLPADHAHARDFHYHHKWDDHTMLPFVELDMSCRWYVHDRLKFTGFTDLSGTRLHQNFRIELTALIHRQYDPDRHGKRLQDIEHFVLDVVDTWNNEFGVEVYGVCMSSPVIHRLVYSVHKYCHLIRSYFDSTLQYIQEQSTKLPSSSAAKERLSLTQ